MANNMRFRRLYPLSILNRPLLSRAPKPWGATTTLSRDIYYQYRPRPEHQPPSRQQSGRRRLHIVPNNVDTPVNLNMINDTTAESITLTAPNGVTWTQERGSFINNIFCKGLHSEETNIINPTDAQPITTIHFATTHTANCAVLHASDALHSPEWSQLHPQKRGELLHNLASLVQSYATTLATIETLNTGTPYRQVLNETIPDLVSVLRYYAGWCDKISGRTVDSTGANRLAYTIKEPVGVCALIVPWNYPLMMVGWKLGPALACGNTVVVKPAEHTPLSALYLAGLVREAGFPPGVVNVVPGTGQTVGPTLIQHPAVAKVSFTGSTSTAKEVWKAAAGDGAGVKDVSLELGGKSPLLVFEDANLNKAAKWAHAGIMSNNGQICTGTSRIIVHERVYEEFLERFCLEIDKAPVGDPWKGETFHGPLVSGDQYRQVLKYGELAKLQGATVYKGGGRVTPEGCSRSGYFVEPTVFTDVESNMQIYQEEVFGPYVTVEKFEDEDGAVKRANNSKYGLAAAVFTRDIGMAHRVVKRLRAGIVWINSSGDSDYRLPFGGMKESGIGRELGEEGLKGYYTEKTVYVNMDDD